MALNSITKLTMVSIPFNREGTCKPDMISDVVRMQDEFQFPSTGKARVNKHERKNESE